jgi:hypothetical protein
VQAQLIEQRLAIARAETIRVALQTLRTQSRTSLRCCGQASDTLRRSVHQEHEP